MYPAPPVISMGIYFLVIEIKNTTGALNKIADSDQKAINTDLWFSMKSKFQSILQ
jgi:hypothetical protein